MGKIDLKNLSENWPKEPIFIGDPKYSRWGPNQVKTDLSVDRPIYWPTVKFLIVGADGRPAVRPPKGNLPVGRPPDRPRPAQESKLLVGRPVDRPPDP